MARASTTPLPTYATTDVILTAVNAVADRVDDLDANGTVYTTYGATGLLAVASKSTTYTATTADELVLCTAGSGGWTLTLYTAVGNTGRLLRVKKVDSGLGTVTVDANGSQTIDGQLTYAIQTQWASVTLASDGSNWVVIGEVG